VRQRKKLEQGGENSKKEIVEGAAERKVIRLLKLLKEKAVEANGAAKKATQRKDRKIELRAGKPMASY